LRRQVTDPPSDFASSFAVGRIVSAEARSEIGAETYFFQEGRADDFS
jgi:uncharacterized membrane-anchored protein